MELVLRKGPGSCLIPGNEETNQALQKMKLGQILHGHFKKLRNPKFLAKFMALVRFLFENWEPGELQDPRWKGVRPQKSFERFRKDLIILAGFYEASYRLDGSVRIEAQSISFGRMSEEEFEELCQRVIDVGLQKILPAAYDSRTVRATIDQLLAFS